MPEIFIYSSNIGAAKMALDLGIERHKEFLGKIGLLSRLSTEIGEERGAARSLALGAVNTITIAYGHGLSVTPLQLATATLPLVNGEFAVDPTFLPRTRMAGSRKARACSSPSPATPCFS